MTDFAIHPIDIGIIVIYFIVVLGIGISVARRTKTSEDLFLAGRTLAWGAIGFSLFASNISSTTLIGLAGSAYSSGLAVANYEWMASLVLVFMTLFFIPFYIKSRISTMPEFLEKRFDSRIRKYFSVITIFLSIVVDTAGPLYAGALVLQTFFHGLDITITCIVLALIAGIYTAAGGLAAVVYTDVIQAIVLLLGTFILSLIAFGQFDFSWAAATAGLPEGHLSVIRPLNDPGLPWLGTIVGLPILGFYYWATNQYIVQRVLGARNVDHARWGAMLCALLKLLPLFIMVLPGAFAFKLFPNLSNADQVFPTMVINLLPVGIVGLVLAGLIAAIMSSVDSTLNSASTLVTLDFIVPKHPNLKPEEIAKIGRIATGVFMLFAVLWAPFIRYFGGLFDYLQTAFSYVVPPIAAIFLMGLFWERSNAQGAFFTLIGGHTISLVLFILGPILGIINIHFSIMAGILTAISCFIFYSVSLQTAPPPEEKIRDLTWKSRALESASMPVYKDHRFQAGVVLILTAATVIVFW
ncbi:MAG: sodium:solute symporter [Planctomycetota bacterium]|jgi:SSS family solute:Na+ symporter